MACARRSLTSSFKYLPRGLHPSFSHVVSHDRDRSESSQSPALNRPTPFRSLLPNRTSSLGFGSFPLGLDPFLRAYSSSSSSAGGSSGDGFIQDVANVLTDSSIDAIAASSVPLRIPGEVAAAAADSFPPVAALQHVIDAVANFTGLNWWASIALTTVIIRTVTVPLLLNQMKAANKLNAMRPEMEELKDQMQNSMGDPQTMAENQKKMKELFKKHGVNPFSPLKGLFIQGPIFISFFLAIQNMVEKVPSFKSGGAYWFTDLTTPDPFYALPVLTALTFLATVELNMQEGMEGNPMAGTMKKFSRGIGVMTVPFTASFPKAIFCYWITANLFSLVYGLVLKRPAVRTFLNLPPVNPGVPASLAVPTGSPRPNFLDMFTPISSRAPAEQSEPLKSLPQVPAEQSESLKATGRKISSSAVISQRIKTLEKKVKGRNKPKKR